MIQGKTLTVLLALVFLPACMSAQVDVLPPEENTPDTATSTLPEFGVTIEDAGVAHEANRVQYTVTIRDYNEESEFDVEEESLVELEYINLTAGGRTLQGDEEVRRINELPFTRREGFDLYSFPWSCGDTVSGSVEVNPSGRRLVTDSIRLEMNEWTEVGDSQMRITSQDDEYLVETRSNESDTSIYKQQVPQFGKVDLPPLSFRDRETPNDVFVREGEVFTADNEEIKVVDIQEGSITLQPVSDNSDSLVQQIPEGGKATVGDTEVGIRAIRDNRRNRGPSASIATPPVDVPGSAQLFADELEEADAILFLHYETKISGVSEAGLEGPGIPSNRQTYEIPLTCPENPTSAPARVLAEDGDEYSIDGTEFAIERVGRNVVLLSVEGERLLMQSDDIYKGGDVNVKVEEFPLHEEAAQLLFYDRPYGAAQTDIKRCVISQPFSCPNEPSLDTDNGVLSFKLANTGPETITLEELRVSSEESSTTCLAEKLEYTPGETTVLRCPLTEDLVSSGGYGAYRFSLEADMYTTRVGPEYMRTLYGSIRVENPE